MGKKDAKREYYQVEEARRKHRTNCATRSEVRVVTRRVQSKRVGENEAFCWKGFFFKLGVERVKLVAFRMVSTVIKYNALCHARATRRFHCEPHDMVICK